MPSSAACGITRLGLRNFRNYTHLALPCDASYIVLTGPNGIGKTNILEAVSLLAPGRGLRNARPSQWHKTGVQDWGVSATLQDGTRLGTSVPQDMKSQRRVVTHEGTTLSSQAKLAEFLAIVWLTPQMDGLFLAEASERRKFIDRLVYAADPNHAMRLYRYEHALRQRNKLLKDKASHTLIRSLHPVLVEAGVAIAAARLENAEQLNSALRAANNPFPMPFLSWSGQVEEWLQEKDALSVEDLYRAQLDSQIDEDRASGQTKLGVHRSDVTAVHAAKNIPAAQCSTGEQKALLLSLVLAHAQWLKSLDPQRPMLLLMDDVAAHLDETRRRDVFDWIKMLQVQTWFTGTDRFLFAALEGDGIFYNLPFSS